MLPVSFGYLDRELIRNADLIDVYALEVARGGDACIGEMHDHAHDHAAHSDASSSAAAPASTTAAPAQSSAAANVPAPPAESTGCVLHDDHYHCEGPASATASAESAEATAAGDCHTHADGGEFELMLDFEAWHMLTI